MQSGNCSGGVEKHEQDSCFSDKASFYILKQDYKDKLFQIWQIIQNKIRNIY